MKLPADLLADLRGGLVAAAVVLPQATAFGVTVFAPLLGAGPGALAGLIGAILLLLISGSAGGTVGLISGPNGPSMALLTGTVAVLASAGLAPAAIAPALFIVTLLAGLIQLLMALAGGGRLIKFIPYPVIAGLTTSIGFLLLTSQIKPMLGISHAGSWSQWHLLPIMTAAVAFGLTRYGPRVLPRLPGAIIGLIGGAAIFHLGSYVADLPAPPDHWVIGILPHLSAIHWPLDPFTYSWSQLPWSLILYAAFALAVLASLNTLLTSVVADGITGLRHNARRELLAQSVGQIAVGLAGGVAGSASVGTTTTSVLAAPPLGGADCGSDFVAVAAVFWTSRAMAADQRPGWPDYRVVAQLAGNRHRGVGASPPHPAGRSGCGAGHGYHAEL
ncbi:MAG: SulP family inorganic anion transporter [Synechococcaceae cyanobacterium SM1_2_3]|nr:SulP family inorganic anion transporter [Synechococcaceae cyanobacterium SM1_2_3]